MPRAWIQLGVCMLAVLTTAVPAFGYGIDDLPAPMPASEAIDRGRVVSDAGVGTVLDFDPYAVDIQDDVSWPPEVEMFGDQVGNWSWQLLPDGLLYRSYLAGFKESRFAGVWAHEKDQDWIWDISLGGRVGVLRYGSEHAFRPEGWQLDIEGAAFPRLDLEENRDLDSADFRFGVPLTYASGMYETKFAYYHTSSHLGDEYLEKHPDAVRINYSRDVIVLGNAIYLSDSLRFYGEVGYAFYNSGGSQPWEFQFGAEFTPIEPCTIRGVPFAAINAHLREEVNFGGTLTVQAGWQWRGPGRGHLFRFGLQYLNGKSPQFQFFDTSEEQLGIGLWYDY